MKYLIIMGSPREKGNTAALLNPFREELERLGESVRSIDVRGKSIHGCVECFRCQKVMDGPGCGLRDDMDDVFMALQEADVVVMATPIFTWFCPPELKALMDRCFCLSKNYNGLAEQPMLLAGKKAALITTFGADAATGPDLLETALERLCAYSGMDFIGHLGVRDVHGIADFTCDSAAQAARAFAASLAERSRDRMAPPPCQAERMTV